MSQVEEDSSQNTNSNTNANAGNNSNSNLSSLDFTSLAKTLNFNLPMKLDRNNFINWKAQVSAAIRALELEDFIDSSKLPPAQFLEDHTPNPEYRAWKRSD